MHKQLIITNAEGQDIKAEYSAELAADLLAMGINIEQEITEAIVPSVVKEDTNTRRE